MKKKEYQNPQTNAMFTATSTVIMASPYADLGGGGTLGGLSVPGRKVYI